MWAGLTLELDLGEPLSTSMRASLTVLVPATILTLGALLRPADAQIVQQYFPTDLPGYQSDIMLPMPDYDPRILHGRGFRIDGLDVDASASETAGYESRPLGSFGGASPTLQTDAGLGVHSDWSRNAIGADLGVDDHRYTSTSIADYTNWNAAVGGSLDVGQSRVNLGYDHLGQNLGPTELGVLAITAPVPYSDDDERLNANIPFAQVQWVPAIEHQQFNFDNLTTPIPLEYSNNDHDIWTGSLTGLYQLSKGRSIVALVRGSTAGYVSNGTGIRNDYNDILGFVGINFQADAVFEVRALVGAENRQFRFIPSQSGTIPAAEIDLIWQPTRLTDVLLWFSREYQDPTFPFASTEVTTLGRAEVEHALRRNVELRAFASVGASDYSGGGNGVAALPAERNAATNQLLTTLGAEAEWNVNRNLALRLNYNHSINDFGGQVSAFVTPANNIRSYNDDTITLGVTLRR